MGELFLDYVEAFTPMHSKDPLSLFHLGGDEVNFKCWSKDNKIRDWLRAQGMEYDLLFNADGYLYLWSKYQEKALRALTTANKDKFQDGVVLWSSELTKPGHIGRFLDASKYIIQVWTSETDSQIGEWLKQKYRHVTHVQLRFEKNNFVYIFGNWQLFTHILDSCLFIFFF